MDAPIYPAAEAYEVPTPAPFDFGIDTLSIAELMTSPAIMAIVTREIPAFNGFLEIPQMRSNLTNFTLRSFELWNVAPAEQVNKVDRLIRALPVSERPKL